MDKAKKHLKTKMMCNEKYQQFVRGMMELEPDTRAKVIELIELLTQAKEEINKPQEG